ncbi:SCO family protein [Phyllobacterium bourgognense]|uniref:Protein SCO1/2 n=1 Tax=Phyllobacterium bourgognense TaxID=314236 RepID=A0A368Z0U5_9HYPH|nr:SCO family protein [Phyllobacterium bourgognense]RCW86082.1 protein SCO1/2 [Phyllobacterium bourgognense]
MNKRLLPFLIVAIALLAGAAGWITFQSSRQTTTTGNQGPFGTSFELTTMNGEPITEAAFRQKPSAIFFGFTHCPEVCPTTLFELDGWLKKLGTEGAYVNAYFVTVDPERDTVPVMKSYVSNVSDRITGVTGDPDKIAAMLKGYSVFARKVPVEGGDYTMDHTASIFLLDSKGRFFGTIAYGENPDTAVEKLKRLAKS